MKKLILIIAFIALTVSCSDDITGLNQDTKNPTTTKAEFLFTNAQKAIVDQMVSTSVNLNVYRLFAQHWTETTYPDESQYDITTRTIPANTYQALYRDGLKDLANSRALLNAEAPIAAADIAVLNNKKAIVDIMMVYTYSVLVDTFGDVPYSEALDLEAHPLPKYDDAKTIYKDLLARLATDVSLLSSSANFGAADLIYAGDAMKWKKFANSLRLRMGVNMIDVEAPYATAQITAALASGIISSNADNTNLNYLDTSVGNSNPLYADLVVSQRNDFVPANTLVNKMNALTDPRRAKYFTLKGGVYVGGTYGTSNSFASFSHISATLNDQKFPGTIFDYAEVQFLLAEAAAKGVAVGGTAATHYTAGITASMQNWGVDAADILTYLALPSVAYATATGSDKRKIGEQAWIALYNRGFEAWTSVRRLDFPALVAPAVTYNNQTTVPVRYTYPSREQQLNATNVTAAATAIGGDKLSTKLFWDKF
ncbi:SusD/RagB family nutrient-binding outer membrane lipoprotein [Flavobacterium sp. ZS1P14]|uniref:SusD/RagB family nutrient-binding outer membrane lipoprotein n=1 Tax=Flavobacterium sp. ZS1P14 TaxID=3401729 RepID=UPI003AAC459B